jgi:hypothetical protein
MKAMRLHLRSCCFRVRARARLRVPLRVTDDVAHGPDPILRSGVLLRYGLDSGGATAAAGGLG